MLLLWECGLSVEGQSWDTWDLQLPVIWEKQCRLRSALYSLVGTSDSSLHPPPAPTWSAFLEASDQCFAKGPADYLHRTAARELVKTQTSAPSQTSTSEQG